MEKTKNEKRSTFSGQDRICALSGRSVCRFGKYLEIPVSCGKVWRRDFFTDLYHSGADFWLHDDRCRDNAWTYDKEKPGGSVWLFWQIRMAFFGGWINAIIPVLIVPYYSVIGGWVIKYLVEYISGHGAELATEDYFSDFISNGASTEICFIIFSVFTLSVIYAGVRNGVERVSKFMMPILVVLSVVIAVYSVTRPGAMEGVKYFLIPNIDNFSWMTVVAAMGQMFYSLSIAMGILVTFGSYMKRDVSIEASTENGGDFDTAIAIMAGLMNHTRAVFGVLRRGAESLGGAALCLQSIPRSI